MLSEALQRNAKHKARLSNISRYLAGLVRKSDQRFFALLRMTFARWVKSCFRVIRVGRG